MSIPQLGRSNVYEGKQYCSKLYRVHKHSDLIHKVRFDCATVYKLAEISDSSFSARCSNSITSSTQVDRFVSDFFSTQSRMYLQDFFDRKFLADLDQKLFHLKNVNIFEFCSDLVLEVSINLSLTQVARSSKKKSATQSCIYLSDSFDRIFLSVLRQKCYAPKISLSQN